MDGEQIGVSNLFKQIKPDAGGGFIPPTNQKKLH